MCVRMMRLLIAAGICLAAGGAAGWGQTGEHDPSYRHGCYYLFLARTPHGCEDCYIPLLNTKNALEQLKGSPTADDGGLITT